MDVCIFSKYRHILGKERKGIHQYRFMDTAIIDYILTIIFAFALTYITTIPVEITTIASFFIGIVCHLLFGVRTNTTNWLEKITNNLITCESTSESTRK